MTLVVFRWLSWWLWLQEITKNLYGNHLLWVMTKFIELISWNVPTTLEHQVQFFEMIVLVKQIIEQWIFLDKTPTVRYNYLRKFVWKQFISVTQFIDIHPGMYLKEWIQSFAHDCAVVINNKVNYSYEHLYCDNATIQNVFHLRVSLQ